MLEMRIQQHFIDSADLQYQLGEALARPLDAAVQALLASVTGGGKVLVAGWGASMSLAQYLVGLLVGGFERARPALPAIGLMANSLPAFSGTLSSLLERQVQALGHAGDVLILLSSEGSGHALMAAIDAAHAGDMTVVAITCAAEEWTQGLRETDVLVVVAHERVARVREVQLLALHCLCDGIDAHLLGEQELT